MSPEIGVVLQSPLPLPREGIETQVFDFLEFREDKFRLLYHFPERGLKPLGAEIDEMTFVWSPLPLPREGIETIYHHL